MKYLAILLLLLVQDEKILTGKKELFQLSSDPAFSWFGKGVEAYQPNSDWQAKLNKIDWKGVSITVIGGTWCEDTQKLLPQFVKILQDAAPYSLPVQYYFVDRQKESPEKVKEKYKITNIPVFIVYRNGKEQGRIIETVKTSLEEDLYKLLSANL